MVTDLHLHSSVGSPLDGYGIVEDVIERAVKVGRKAIALTEHDNLFSAAYFEQDAVGKGIKPIFGAEMRLVGSIKENKRRKHHYTLLCNSVDGYKNLCKIVSKAWNEGYYYLPTTDWSMLRDHNEGLTVLSGCPSGLVQRFLADNEYDNALKAARKYKDIFGDNFYIEIMAHGESMLDHTKAMVPLLDKISRKIGSRMVITNDVHMLEKGQVDIWKILSCIKRRQTWKEATDLVSTAYQLPEDKWYRLAKEVLDGSLTRGQILKLFETQERIASDSVGVSIPKSGTPEYTDKDKTYLILKKLVYKGLQDHGHVGKKEYEDRVSLELDRIKRKEFSNYLLVVWDIINWAKSKGIMVGPGRGSSSNSLVCYLIGITVPDPVEMDLSFDRFISEDRKDLPDIDIDFEDRHRERVVNYLRDKYGDDKVGNLITYSHFNTRGILNDLGKVFEIPGDQIEIVSRMAVYRSMADARASLTTREMTEEFPLAKKVFKDHPALRKAFDIEGQVRHYGRNAAGVLISSIPLEEFTTLTEINGVLTAGVDIFGSEYLGALKMDILGLRTLSVLKDILDIKKKTVEWLYKLPLDDEKTINLFKKVNTRGVFQFEANAVKSLLGQIEVSEFNDIVALTSLARPGPLHSGTAQLYKEYSAEGNRYKWPHKIINQITKDSKGLILYQEQVMRVAREVGGMSWDDVSALRGAMSKSKGVEFFDQYREKFRPGARKSGMNDKEIDELWTKLCQYGSWAFNKGHATSYALISYYCAYAKAHWPYTFYKVVCNYESDPEKINSLLREYIEEEYGDVLSPKFSKSNYGFELEGHDLRTGFIHVPGIGDKAATMLEDIRRKHKLTKSDQIEKYITDRRIINSRVMTAVNQWGLFDDKEYDLFDLYSFKKRLERTTREHKIGDLGYSFDMRRVKLAGVLVGGSGGSSVSHINLKSVKEVMETVKVSGQVNRRFDAADQKLDAWCIMQLMDDTGQIQIQVKPKEFKRFKETIYGINKDNDIVLINGIVPPSRGYIVAKNIEVWDDSKYPGSKCYECPLSESKCLKPQLVKKSKIMFVAEAPGYKEIENEEFLVGPSGQQFTACCEAAGIDRKKESINNVLLGRPTDGDRNRTPTEEEISACSGHLKVDIDKINPRVIVAMGATSINAILGGTNKVSDVLNQKIKMNGRIVIPTYHPATILYSGGGTRDTIIEAMKMAKEISIDD